MGSSRTLFTTHIESKLLELGRVLVGHEVFLDLIHYIFGRPTVRQLVSLLEPIVFECLSGRHARFGIDHQQAAHKALALVRDLVPEDTREGVPAAHDFVNHSFPPFVMEWLLRRQEHKGDDTDRPQIGLRRVDTLQHLWGHGVDLTYQ